MLPVLIRATENYTRHFETMTQRNGFCSCHVFNRGETGLSQKKMSKRIHIPQGEKKMPGHRPMKDRLPYYYMPLQMVTSKESLS